MEIIKASIYRDNEVTKLILPITGKKLELNLTSDNPNEIKKTFNELILELKKKEFNFKLEDEKNDLYTSVCEEYISQLNNEIKTIRSELVEYGLVKTE
ncbi:MAG: hypothetical protein ACPKPY_08140 [Nitrososphaeraceae archaeon]